MARTNESPMDFQWQQGYGPSGTDSPFLKSITNNHSHKSSLPNNSRASVFPSTPSTKMPPQFRNSSFTTPQKSRDCDFSSGPENMSSPANGDTEDTPEPTPRTEPAKINNAMVQFKAEKKQPALGIFGRYGMSGRGEIQRGRPHNDIIARRIHKRKRREGDRDRIIRRRPSDNSDDEDDPPHRDHSGKSHESTNQQKQEIHQVGAIPAFFSYLETHPNLPHVLSYYAQFLLNFFLVAVLIYMVYAFWSTIRSDVNEKSKEAASEILVEMAMCAREFKDNKCDSKEGRVPAMESICSSWEKCMARDPTMVGRAKVSAKTFAEIIDNFFQPISVKAMLSLAALLLGCLAANNLTMYLFRHKTHPSPPPHQPPQYPQPPSTPHQQAPDAGNHDQFYTPYQHRGQFQAVEYGNHAGAGGRHSPTKRLGFR